MAAHYINSVGIISPQKTFDSDQFLTEVKAFHNNVLTCQFPDFKTYINPVQLRRLSRMLRIGLTSAILCQRGTSTFVPDAIITATGYGFLEETEKFLREILDRQEKQISPTFFMQGTYNALAGLVALSLKCTGYNNTYVSKGFAFENALTDGMMQIDEAPKLNILVGAYDEAAEVLYTTGLREGNYKHVPLNSLQLYDSTDPGTIQGEGAAFFLLSGLRVASTLCEVVDTHTLFRPDASTLSLALISFLKKCHCSMEEIDLLVHGMSGDPGFDALLTSLRKSMSTTPEVRFKHLSGEYCTASSFGLWLAARILERQHVPDAVKVNGCSYPAKLQTVLLINHYMGKNYSFTLLKSVV